MSVVGVKEESTRTHSQNWKQQRTYQRTYVVRSSVTNEDPLNVVNASVGGVTIPALLSAYPTDSFALVQNRSVQQQSNRDTWKVTVDYNSLFDEDPNYYVPNPLDRYTKVDIDTQTYQFAVKYDINGDPIENKAKVPFDPPETVDLVTPVLILSKYKATVDFTELATLQMVMNSDTYLGFAPKTLLLRRYTADRVQENGHLVYLHKYEIAVKFDTWKRKLLNAGFQFLDEEDNLLQCRDAHGVPFPNPSKLDAEGGMQEPDEVPIFLNFELYRSVSFSTYLPTVP